MFRTGENKTQRENATMGIEVGKRGGESEVEGGGGYTVLMALVIMSL